jgi:ketosteroid isomerase-like protein
VPSCAVEGMPARGIESVSISGDRIPAVARWDEGQGPPGVDRVYNLLAMRDGLVVRMNDYFDAAAAQRAFSEGK